MAAAWLGLVVQDLGAGVRCQRPRQLPAAEKDSAARTADGGKKKRSVGAGEEVSARAQGAAAQA